MKRLILFLLIGFAGIAYGSPNQPFVTARIYGQLGNNFFQVAAASALAWDNQAEPTFPDFDSSELLSLVYRHIFFRFNKNKPSAAVNFVWNEPLYSHQNIPYNPDMQIIGYFQSEKYFAHHRDRLLELFAPHPEDAAYIQEKYRLILNHPNTVGVQIRYFRWENPPDSIFPQYGRDYFETAMALFPEALFVVSSNNLEFARRCVPEWVKNVIFLENEPHYIDFYLLSFCKHNIISNSSFGWWIAWLNQNPNKIVVRPDFWMHELPTQDVCPKEWISVHAKYD